MADEYLDLDLKTEATVLYQDAIEAIEALAPQGWTPSPIEQWLLSAAARLGVEITVLAGQVPLAIFTYFGESGLGVPPIDAAHAIGSVTFTLTDTDGHTVDAGTQLDIDGVAFVTSGDLDVPAGLATGTIDVISVDPGIAGNGLPGASVALVSPPYTFVESVILDETTSGGLDAETPRDYADRLAEELPTLSPKGILISDFERLARRHPSVGRALGIDNYDPGPPVDDAAAGHVTVAIHDAAGAPLPAPVRATIAAQLEGSGGSARVLNLVVHVIDPTYTQVDVDFTATVHDGWDSTSVEDEAIAAIEEFLDPANWGRPTSATAADWVDEATLRRNDLLGVVYRVPGIRHVTALTLALAGATLGDSDVALTGPAALPLAASVTGSVT